MPRCRAALILIAFTFILTPACFAKAPVQSAAPAKRVTSASTPATVKPATTASTAPADKKSVVSKATVDTNNDDDDDTTITQPSVIEEDGKFSAPEGALYTTSDDCA